MTDRRQEITDDMYMFLWEFSPFFRTLSMDRQGEIVVDAVNYKMEHEDEG